jgi:iron-sulfur cluster assembly accessory protein
VITVTEPAVRMVRRILEREKRDPTTLLRLAVRGGGCNGFSYEMTFEPAAQPDDEQLEFHGLRVVVDSKSRAFLDRITLDYVDGLESRFVWRNPLATKTCSCGESFDV